MTSHGGHMTGHMTLHNSGHVIGHVTLHHMTLLAFLTLCVPFAPLYARESFT